jgi:hypothetical protein
MRSVAVAEEVATVGAGVRLGDLYDELAEHGLTIPAGCGSSVGIAGLTLGGGLGILGRKHGLTCDHLLRAQVVLADGRVVECDEHHDGELFWALRGAAGGHFGVVTSLVFRTVPAPATTVFHLIWPPAAAAAVVRAWQAYAPDALEELDATLRLTAAGDDGRQPGVEVVGSVLDCEADAAELLGEMVGRVGADPVAASRRHLPHRAAKRHLEGLGSVEDRRERSGPERPLQSGHLYTKSEFFRRPLPADTIATLVEHLIQGLAPGQSREVDFLPWGAPTTACPPTRQHSPIAANASWSSTWSRSAPTPHRPSAQPPATGWRARGRWYIHGDPGVCTRTSQTPTSRTGRTPITGPTTTVCGG